MFIMSSLVVWMILAQAGTIFSNQPNGESLHVAAEQILTEIKEDLINHKILNNG